MEADDRPWTQRLFSGGLGVGGTVVLMVLMYLFARFLCYCCCCGCCRRRPTEREGAAADPQPGELRIQDSSGATYPVAAEHLSQAKNTGTTYLLCVCGGIFGAHHFYLDRLVHGVVCLWTGNFFMFGWILDLFLIPIYVRGHNKRSAHAAPSAASCKFLSCRLLLVYFVACVAVVIALVKLPRGLHDVGLIDIDMKMAGTTQNPYDLLDVPRGCSPTKAYLAYGEQVKRLNPTGRPCTGLCQAKMDDLQKAAVFINGGWREQYAPSEGTQDRRSARRHGRDDNGEPLDSWDNWDDWADFIALEWDHILKHVGEALRDPADPPPARKKPRDRSRADRGGRVGAAGPSPADWWQPGDFDEV